MRRERTEECDADCVCFVVTKVSGLFDGPTPTTVTPRGPLFFVAIFVEGSDTRTERELQKTRPPIEEGARAEENLPTREMAPHCNSNVNDHGSLFGYVVKSLSL